MSLIDRPGRYTITVYPEVMVVDKDGNKATRAGDVGIEATATIHPMGFSGTAARRAEMDREGHISEQIATMYFPRGDTQLSHPLGAQSVVIWEGKKWQLFGDAKRFNGSDRTARLLYQLKRT